MTLDQLVKDRNNNFNLIRFFAAFIVLVSHSYSIFLGSVETEPLYAAVGITLGTLAVDIFFITSGFLIAASFFSRSKLAEFIWARFLRIYPALIVSVLVTILLLGILVSSLPLTEYLSDSRTFRYLVVNSIMVLGIEYSLPGVFENNPVGAINGSMWTLPWEVRMYVLLACICSILLSLERRWSWLAVVRVVPAIAAVSLTLTILDAYFHFYDGKGLRLFSMFFIGTSFYLLRDKIVMTAPIFWSLVAVLVWGLLNSSVFYLVYCVVLPYLVFYLAYIPKGSVLLFNKLGDYSYGLYIFAFPVQQTLIHFFPDATFNWLMGLSALVTMLFAVCSWHLVEKRALGFKRYAEKVSDLFGKRPQIARRKGRV